MTDLLARCEEHVGDAHPPRCAACDDALESMMQGALAGSLTTDARSAAIVAGYLESRDDWAVATGEEDPWGPAVDDGEPF